MDQPSRFIQRLYHDDSGAFRKVWQAYYRNDRGIAQQFIGSENSCQEDLGPFVSKHFGALLMMVANDDLAHIGSRDHFGTVLQGRLRDDMTVSDELARRSHDHLPTDSSQHAATVTAEEAEKEAAADYLIWTSFLESLPRPELRAIANLKRLGWTHEQISEMFGFSVHSAKRKVKVIREYWNLLHGQPE